MKNGFLLAVLSLFIFSCAQEELTVDQTTNDTPVELRKAQKVDVCHYDEEENKWVLINVSINSVPAHRAHGDAVDMDGDGYFDKENGCGPVDCDDTDPTLTNNCCPCFTLNEILTNEVNYAYFDTEGGSFCRFDGTGFEERGDVHMVLHTKDFCVLAQALVK